MGEMTGACPLQLHHVSATMRSKFEVAVLMQNIPCPSAAEIESAEINWHFFGILSEGLGYSLSNFADTVTFASGFCSTSSLLGEDACLSTAFVASMAASSACVPAQDVDHCSTKPEWNDEECMGSWFELHGISATTTGIYTTTSKYFTPRFPFRHSLTCLRQGCFSHAVLPAM